uniref:ATP synthase F0 subunit 8 n=2 Tax=Oulema TaxID=41131 RepID=A0A1P8NM35_9CUCU|nr:ATP synthase F0 subunit 8 [Oulema erichsonii]APX39198.1 ATP synthase F0 subunit 8 [Oulema erichsonii]ARH54549.1 ATP synthase F0 subunit 8 [Oulema melanopus]
MPQMAPLNWISLMIYFLLMFYMLNMMNYFINLYQPFKFKITKKTMTLNWKW